MVTGMMSSLDRHNDKFFSFRSDQTGIKMGKRRVEPSISGGWACLQSVNYRFDLHSEKMRGHLIGYEAFFRMARRISRLRYASVRNCRI
jgi:hypothetical protein